MIFMPKAEEAVAREAVLGYQNGGLDLNAYPRK